MSRRALSLLCAIALCATGCACKPPRSPAARAEFVRLYPCPSKSSTGTCPGYVVDHITPLCAGGPDRPDNMQWQTVEASRAKDAIERATCRKMRHASF